MNSEGQDTEAARRDRRIFISYRRSDTQWVAGRLSDSLRRYFGDDRVFRDIEEIGGGADFIDTLHSTLGSADAVIVLIGEGWYVEADDGVPRIFQPDDWVAQEIGYALEQGIPVYPVLVEDTPMPRSEALPESLQRLLRYNAVTIGEKRWDDDVQRLAKIVALDIPPVNERLLDRVNLIASAGLALIVLIITAIAAWKSVGFNGFDSTPFNNKDECDALADNLKAILTLGQAGIVFAVVVACSAMLFVNARLVDESKRRFFRAAAWVGAVGAFLVYLLVLPICNDYEPLYVYFLSLMVVMVMFALLCLSGFRAK